MKKVIIRYGLIAGAIVSVLMLLSLPLMNNLNKENEGISMLVGYVSMILSISTIFIAIKTFRDKYNEGKMKFGKAFLIGLYITLIAAAIYALVFVIADALSGEAFVESYRNMQLDKINSDTTINLDQKHVEITKMEEQMKMYRNPIVKFFFTMLEYFPVGLGASLLAALILKKK